MPVVMAVWNDFEISVYFLNSARNYTLPLTAYNFFGNHSSDWQLVFANVVIATLLVTPPDWDCLDGTLYFEGRKVYMIFSHEWTQVGDGEICAVELDSSLQEMIDIPRVLFRASEADWTVVHHGFDKTGYGMGIAYAQEYKERVYFKEWRSLV